VLPNIRDGLLIHTGNWSTTSVDWDETMDMPNSSGCIHGHPTDVQKIYNILVSLGVKVNPNTYSGKNYPYKPQGIAVIELMD
jgi:lipoprotein-anchoring transpeptidase ErfK/SrfK